MSRTGQTNTDLDLISLPRLKIKDGTYELLETAPLHTRLVQAAVEKNQDIAIITPTLHSGYLDYHAISALFQDMGNLTPVFIITPNTTIRDRYEQIANGLHYSTDKWPLATVKNTGELTYRTQHVRSSDAPPGVIFTRFSTRLPDDNISRDIRTVLYDDAVKFEEERWERFQEWRQRNEIPSSVYFLRDPIGPVYNEIKNEVDAIWSWTPTGLAEVVDQLEKSQNRKTTPVVTGRERQFLTQKIRGQEYQIHACTEGEVADAFEHLWSTHQELEETAEALDEQQVWNAVGVSRRAVNGFSRLLSNLEYSDHARGSHSKAVPLSGRVGQISQAMNRLSGEAAAGHTSIEHVHHALTELQDVVSEPDNNPWKRTAVLTALQKIAEDEDRLIIVFPDRPAIDGFEADMRITHTEFYSKVKEHAELHTPRSLPNANPADYLLLYGPPKFSHRWVLRAPHAPYVGILTYGHELGLLHTQISSLNQSLEEATPTGDDLDNGILSQLSLPDLFSDNDKPIEEQPNYTTHKDGYDGIDIDFPTDEELADGTDTAITEYDLTGTDPQMTVSEVFSSPNIDFDVSDASYSPTTERRGGPQDSRNDEEKIDDCVEIQVKSGKALTIRPNKRLEVVNADLKTNPKKPASNIQPGEQIVVVQNRDAVREVIERLLLDSGYIDLVGYARLWKNKLQTEIERTGDDLQDFKGRLEDEGLDKIDSTYEAWYYGEIHQPKAKESLYKLAQAYEMSDVLDEFENVWDANHQIRQIKRDYIDLLKQRRQKSLIQGEEVEGDIVLDEELDIRLSDLKETDESGEKLVEVHIVTEVTQQKEVPKSALGRWRSVNQQ